MEEFLNKLYNYEYFGVYLMIAIAVLVLLFIIVLFFGKKDQKKREIEETKRIQQINNQDAFKQDNNVASVEVPNEPAPTPVLTQEKLENDTIIVPDVSNIASFEETNTNVIPEPVLPKEEINNEMPVNVTDQPIIENTNLSNEIPVSTPEPVLDKVEEKPLVFNEQPSNVDNEISMPEEANPTVPLVDVPDFNFDEIISGVEEIKEEEKEVKPAESFSSEVFSSVYAPEKENNMFKVPKIL